MELRLGREECVSREPDSCGTLSLQGCQPAIHHSFWHTFSFLRVNEGGKAHLNVESPFTSVLLVETSNKWMKLTHLELDCWWALVPAHRDTFLRVGSPVKRHFWTRWFPCDILVSTRGKVEESSSQFNPDSRAVLRFAFFFSAAGASFTTEVKSPRPDKTKNNDFELTGNDTDWLFCNHIDSFNEDVQTEPWLHYRKTFFHIKCTCCMF